LISGTIGGRQLGGRRFLAWRSSGDHAEGKYGSAPTMIAAR
jgi:hypothetical protein